MRPINSYTRRSVTIETEKEHEMRKHTPDAPNSIGRSTSSKQERRMETSEAYRDNNRRVRSDKGPNKIAAGVDAGDVRERWVHIF